jgi:hypothetical protein
MPTDLCRVCDHPREGHGRRYTASYGEHEWMAPRDARAVHERTSDRAVPHPAGGITYPTDPEGTRLCGDRLFYGRTTA